MNPLVSVIVPVYNVEKYIEDSLLSICKQTYNNIEIVIIDDESKDSSILIAKRILEQCPFQVKYISEENKGLPGARNAGLEIAAGDYVCFIDSDDIISADHIKRSVGALIEHNAGVCYSDFEYTNIKNRWGKEQSYNGNNALEHKKILELFSDRTIKIHCCSLMIRRQFLVDNQLLFNERLRFGEDVEFMWHLFSYADTVIHVEQNSYKYLIRNNSIMSSASTDKWILFIEVFKESLEKLGKVFPENKDTYHVVYNRTLLGLGRVVAKNTEYSSFVDFIKKYDKKEIRKVLKKSKDIKVRIMAIILYSNRLFYCINH